MSKMEIETENEALYLYNFSRLSIILILSWVFVISFIGEISFSIKELLFLIDIFCFWLELSSSKINSGFSLYLIL